MKTYYKVVRRVHYAYGIKYHSYLFSELGKYSIRYKINEWIFPIIGKIFIFDELENAIDFTRGRVESSSLIVFSCEAINARKLAERSQWAGELDISKFWSRYYQDDDFFKDSTSTPRGTFGADGIKLIKQVR